jgi:two-component system, OmpR family, sensor kinase
MNTCGRSPPSQRAKNCVISPRAFRAGLAAFRGRFDLSGDSPCPSSLPDDVAHLRVRIAELEQALQARDEFLSIAAHELRNPMHSLLLQVSAAVQVARQLADSPLIRRLERVQQIVDRYVKRASLLLDVGRMNATRQRPQVESVDFAQVVREVVESYTPEALFNRCTLQVDVPPTLPGRWDRLGLEQIVSNLLSNAIKFGAGSAINVSLRSVEGKSVELQILDRGIGIADADQERIFGRFERLFPQAGHPAGAGVGLWLVRGLVEAHGGSISVHSAVAQGATFTVTLPLDGDSHTDLSND